MNNAKRQAEVLNSLLHSKAFKHPDEEDETLHSNKRLLLQHNRDRIVWSSAFKRLAHKTQVFPQQFNDHQRRRLTHSLEVMQLSTSIARTIGLNSFLCEAIALGHDLGHTPFGHAGEEAINTALHELHIDEEADVKGLSSFTHYEQGLDVVSYISGKFHGEDWDIGLKLHHRVLEGILKHTYDYLGSEVKKPSLKYLIKHTKYKNMFEDYLESCGSLEGQIVRICDKLSYLVSDMEDGLIIGAIHIDDLSKNTIFSESLNEVDKVGTDEIRVFEFVRNEILTKVINSVLSYSSNHIAEYDGSQICIRPEEAIFDEMNNVFKNLQKGILFKHFFVERSNNRAKHIVSCLFCQYLRNPELIPWRFRSKYIEMSDFKKYIYLLYAPNHNLETNGEIRIDIDLLKWHTEIFDNSGCSGSVDQNLEDRRLEDIICAKDYVTGMTDNHAESLFKRVVHCPESKGTWNSEQWETVKNSFIV